MNILEKVEAFVTSQLTTKLPNTFLYHNINHTRKVVQFAKELIKGEKIADEEALIIEIAAWFHDIGFIKNIPNHEEIGAEIAKTFLEEEGVEKQLINKIIECILITSRKEEPKNILEKIILDADCAHLGNKNYTQANELLKEELKLHGNSLSNKNWIQENIVFFTTKHRFYTNYAFNNWQATKDKNLIAFLNYNQNKKKEKDKTSLKLEELKLKKQKLESPERGVETMFRVTLRNHITLSNIADTKANILLSVNAIIISLALSNLIPKLDKPSNDYLIIPTAIFIIFSLISIALSVIATRPNVTSGKFTKEDVKQKKVNLLFFGNFHKVSLTDFQWAMGEMMNDKDYLYASMIKDLYFLGKVLDKKYKILRLTYTIFLIGILASVFAFTVSFNMNN